MIRLNTICRPVISNLRPSLSKVEQSTLSALNEEDVNAVLLNIPFSRAKLGPFLQVQPVLGNQYTEDTTLVTYLKRHIAEEVFTEINKDLEKFGSRVATEIYYLGLDCERHPPKLEPFDGWGKRQDKLVTSEAWRKQKIISAEEGLIAAAYERKYGPASRIYQVAKNYMYSASSGLYSCPLAMTDGAAKSLEKINNAELLEKAYSKLTSRDPSKFWTSGQWMTEKRGGSDVADGCETVAVSQEDGSYKLYGYKWFSSATDSDMTLTLARILDRGGEVTPGTQGVSMFYLETRSPDGALNNMELVRLKDKLGTRQLPTAELLLDGTRAYRVSPEGRGVASISTMLMITRIHNCTSSASLMRRVMQLAKDYATKRKCFGKLIKDHSLHIKTLAAMEVETRSALLLTLELSRLLGKDDCGVISGHEVNLLRLLTPLGKLYTAKQAVAVASEGLESFGGAGYLEDTGLPGLLRDAQVLPIWEGTTNILSLDILRALVKSKGQVLASYVQEVHQRLEALIAPNDLQSAVSKVTETTNQLAAFATNNSSALEFAARDFAYSLSRTYMAMLLIEHACWKEASESDVFAAKKWCEYDLNLVTSGHTSGLYTEGVKDTEYQLVYQGYSPTTGSKL